MAETTGAGALAAVLAGAAVYTQLMPSLSDVRRAHADSATARDVRGGLVAGFCALVGVGLIISFAERDARPFWLTTATALLLCGIYELTLRQSGETPPAQPAYGRYGQ